VAYLGKLPGLDPGERAGWEHISEILDGKLKPADFLARPAAPPQWATVNTRGVGVERLRRFGDVYLALALWRRLKLDAFFNEAMEAGREEIAWGTMACILTLARFCAPSSELQIADFWYGKTALDDLLGVSPDKVNDDRLYRGLDALLPQVQPVVGYQPVPPFPTVEQDLAITVPQDVPAGRVLKLIRGFPLVRSVSIFDVYSGPPIPAGRKSLAFSISFQAEDHTLTEAEATRERERIVARLRQELGAEVRSG